MSLRLDRAGRENKGVGVNFMSLVLTADGQVALLRLDFERGRGLS